MAARNGRGRDREELRREKGRGNCTKASVASGFKGTSDAAQAMGQAAW